MLDVNDKATATMTVGAAAKLLGIARGTAYGLARQGLLTGAIKLPGCKRVLVSRRQLGEFLAGRKPAA
jgi:excisionase family DNA binding protein